MRALKVSAYTHWCCVFSSRFFTQLHLNKWAKSFLLSPLIDEFARAVYVATGLKLTRHLVNTIFKIFDVDHDDQLSYKEFIGIMKDRLHRGARVKNFLLFKKKCTQLQLKNLCLEKVWITASHQDTKKEPLLRNIPPFAERSEVKWAPEHLQRDSFLIKI